MAWRRFELAVINESGIVMHNKHASSAREYMKVLLYNMSKVTLIIVTPSFISFWARFKSECQEKSKCYTKGAEQGSSDLADLLHMEIFWYAD